LIVYRICKRRYGETAFTGAGGLESAGRWHWKGWPVVYAASTLSLAALELLVHLGRTDAKIRFVAVKAVIPDDVAIEVLNAKTLPAGWHASPPRAATMELGSQWCDEMRSVAIKVPSAVVQGEFNVLINPLHADFKRLRISPPETFAFDPRLWKNA
jgi:RES domain-containing protein